MLLENTDLAKIDLSTNKEEPLPTGSSFNNAFNTVAVNPLTNIVYVPNSDSNTVYAINSTLNPTESGYLTEIAADSRPFSCYSKSKYKHNICY